MMAKNPFRNKPSVNVHQSVEDWGKSKFKPTKFKNNGEKYFREHSDDFGSNRKFINRKWKNDHRDKKESYKFNEVASYAKPESATPWSKYKNEIVFKQREEEQTAIRASVESSVAKITLKQREINYRKSLIEQKKREPIDWEDFSEDEKGTKKNEEISYETKSKEYKHVYTNKQYENSKGKRINKRKNTENKLDTRSDTNFKKNVSNSGLKGDVKEFISKELLNNFDSKKLNYMQNNKLRAAITKTSFMALGTSLKSVVSSIKKKKEKFNKK